MPYITTCPSPLGQLTLTSDGIALTGLWMDTQIIPDAHYIHQDGLPVFLQTKAWLVDYFLGKNPDVHDLPLSPAGTAFQQRVWEILLTVPYGQTITYGAIAGQLGENMSAQAVGQAVGKNPISIIIPCHRVLGAKGQLTGYAGGVEKKKFLLAIEKQHK